MKKILTLLFLLIYSFLSYSGTIKSSKIEYTDIFLYQGLFYYGESDSILELKKENNSSYIIIHSVFGNNIKEISKEKIQSFSTFQESDRYKDIPCTINNKEYRLFMASTSIKNLKYRVTENGVAKNEKKSNMPVHDYFKEYFLKQSGMKSTELKSYNSITCQDFIALLGEYKAVRRHYVQYDPRDKEIDKDIILNDSVLIDFSIKIFSNYYWNRRDILYLKADGFKRYDSYHYFINRADNIIKRDDIIRLDSFNGAAEFYQDSSIMFINDQIFYQDILSLDIGVYTKYYTFYTLEKVF